MLLSLFFLLLTPPPAAIQFPMNLSQVISKSNGPVANATCDVEEPTCDGFDCGSPIIIALDEELPSFAGKESAIFFDLMGLGSPYLIQWVKRKSDEAFLVLDLNHNGVIDDGTELFGQGSRLVLDDHKQAPNGFAALQQWDDPRLGGNDDGFINAEDLFFEELALWLDLDADGQTDKGEIRSLSSFNIYELTTVPTETKIHDEHGNWLRFWAIAHAYDPRTESPRKLTMVDVYFRIHGVLNDWKE